MPVTCGHFLPYDIQGYAWRLHVIIVTCDGPEIIKVQNINREALPLLLPSLVEVQFPINVCCRLPFFLNTVTSGGLYIVKTLGRASERSMNLFLCCGSAAQL